MKDNKLTQEEMQLANILRNEILKDSINVVKVSPKSDFSKIEYISTNKQPYISPIMTMDEDEILNFVENSEVEQLMMLQDIELERISEVLGIDANTLMEGKN